MDEHANRDAPHLSRPELYSILFALAAVTALLYWRVLGSPFVQDDWLMLDWLRKTSAFAVLREAFSPSGKILYRPLAVGYFLMEYRVFGLSVLPFHLVALVINIFNSLLIAIIIVKLTGRPFLAAMVAVLSAGAATLQIEPLLWLVGFYDTGSMMFGLLAFVLFLHGRSLASAVCLALALLTKESAVTMAGVLLLYVLLLDRTRLRDLLPHGAVCCIYAVIKLLGVSPFGSGTETAYHAGFGPQLISNARSYAGWAMEAILPQNIIPPRVLPGVFIGFFALIVAAGAIKRRDPLRAPPALVIFFAGWVLLGLLPVLPLEQQAYRYYLLPSLAPLLVLFVLMGEALWPDRLRRYGRLVFTACLLMFVMGHWFGLQRMLHGATAKASVADGTNHLLRKAATVDLVRSRLTARYPVLPKKSILVFPGINSKPFGGTIGPRFWYNDSTLDVLTPQQYDSVLASPRTETRPVFIVMVESDTMNIGTSP